MRIGPAEKGFLWKLGCFIFGVALVLLILGCLHPLGLRTKADFLLALTAFIVVAIVGFLFTILFGIREEPLGGGASFAPVIFGSIPVFIALGLFYLAVCIFIWIGDAFFSLIWTVIKTRQIAWLITLAVVVVGLTVTLAIGRLLTKPLEGYDLIKKQVSIENFKTVGENVDVPDFCSSLQIKEVKYLKSFNKDGKEYNAPKGGVYVVMSTVWTPHQNQINGRGSFTLGEWCVEPGSVARNDSLLPNAGMYSFKENCFYGQRSMGFGALSDGPEPTFTGQIELSQERSDGSIVQAPPSESFCTYIVPESLKGTGLYFVCYRNGPNPDINNAVADPVLIKVDH